jgi:hypothetical protein
MVQLGQSFVKYSLHGKPHTRFVYITSDEKHLVWCIKEQMLQSSVP